MNLNEIKIELVIITMEQQHASAPPAPSAPMWPNTYYPPDWTDVKRQEFDSLCGMYEIHANTAQEARCVLSGQSKIIIVDNSGSQSWALGPGKTEIRHSDGSPTARYEEAIEFMKIAIPFMAIDAPNGIELYFINAISGSNSHTGIQSFTQALPLLNQAPSGGTPLNEAWDNVQSRYAKAIDEQGLIAVIVTDGTPTDINGAPGKEAFRRRIKRRKSPLKNIVNFLVTTDKDSDVEYLDGMDKYIPGVDVTDDYMTESAQIRKKQGPRYPFSRGDYVLKAVIGGASAKLDRQDETRACCIIL